MSRFQRAIEILLQVAGWSASSGAGDDALGILKSEEKIVRGLGSELRALAERYHLVSVSGSRAPEIAVQTRGEAVDLPL